MTCPRGPERVSARGQACLGMAGTIFQGGVVLLVTWEVEAGAVEA